ncbi:MAG: MMPL family transporter [Planctomycetes bacterium]|nr:MMPL family transporter [Planctomycetota bacterium]
MLNFLEKKDRWGNGLSLWVIVGMVFLIPISVWSLMSVKLENEVQDWIPKDNADYKVVEWYRRHFPLDEVVLFTWEGSSLDDPRSEQLVQKIRGTPDAHGKLRGGSRYFERVCTPHDLLARMRKNKISADDAIERLEGVLIGSGPVRVRLTEYGRARRDKVIDCLKQKAQSSLGITLEILPASAGSESPAAEGASGSEPALADHDVATPAETSADGSSEDTEVAAADLVPRLAPHDLIINWRGQHWDREKLAAFKMLSKELRLPATANRESSALLIEDCFRAPGTPIAFAVYLSEAGNADRNAAFQWLLTAAQESGIPADAIHMGGSAVVGSALNREVIKSVWDKSVPVTHLHRRSIILLSGLVGGILAFWMLKSFKLAGMVLGVSYYTMLISTALVPLTGGTMNMVLVVLPTLILVTTLSVAIHIANYWQHAAAANLKSAVAEAIKTAYVPCLWAGLTSAIGQASLVTSSLAPIRDFGIYSAVGTLISLAVTLYGLPALLQIWPSKPPRPEELDNAFWHGLAAWIARHHRLVTVMSLLVTGIAIVGLKSFKTETKVIRYFADTTRTVRDYEFIEDRMSGIIPVDVIVRFDRESQQATKFLQRRDLVQRIQSEMEQIPDISGSLSLVDFLPTVADPGEQSSTRERAKYSATSRIIEERVKSGEQAGSRSLLSIAEKATEFNADGDELWRITAQVAVMSRRDYQDLRQELDHICSRVLRKVAGTAEKVPPVGALRNYHPGASHFVTGEIPLFLATQSELLESFITSFVGAFLSIALVVMIVLRNPIAGFLAMIPNVLPIVAVFGIVSWCGVQIDIGSTVTASIALGITIDGTLHLITWFKLGIEEGKSRAEAVALAMGHCGPAMWQTTLVVSVGLLMLYPSALILISRFGWLMTALLGAASVSDLILTPALLAGPLGYIIERLARGEPVEAEAENEDEDTEPEVEAVDAVPAPHIESSTVGVPPKPHLIRKVVRIRRAE